MKKIILSILTTAGGILIADWLRNDPCVRCQKKRIGMQYIVDPCSICNVRKERIKRIKQKYDP